MPVIAELSRLSSRFRETSHKITHEHRAEFVVFDQNAGEGVVERTRVEQRRRLFGQEWTFRAYFNPDGSRDQQRTRLEEGVLMYLDLMSGKRKSI